jgi:hypothetical protein
MRLDKNKHRAGRPANVTYILKGLGKCTCGGNLNMRTNKGRKYAYCSRQRTAPHKYQCFTKNSLNLTAIEDFIWDEVVEFLTDIKKGDVIDKLFDNYEGNQGHREAIIAEAKTRLEKINSKKQRLLSEYIDGAFGKEQVDLKNRQLTDEQEHWQTVIDEQLTLTEDVRLDELMASLKQLDNLFDWGLMTATPEQKKEIIARVLHEFILYQDSRIELRYKLPVLPEQVAELLKVC